MNRRNPSFRTIGTIAAFMTMMACLAAVITLEPKPLQARALNSFGGEILSAAGAPWAQGKIYVIDEKEQEVIARTIAGSNGQWSIKGIPQGKKVALLAFLPEVEDEVIVERVTVKRGKLSLQAKKTTDDFLKQSNLTDLLVIVCHHATKVNLDGRAASFARKLANRTFALPASNRYGHYYGRKKGKRIRRAHRYSAMKKPAPRAYMGKIAAGSGAVKKESSMRFMSARPMAMPVTPPLLRNSRDVRHNTEQYAHQVENTFKKVLDHPLSTFGVDVDTASYSNMRRFLNGHRLPPAGAIRIEEMVNYFTYDYKEPKGDIPFSVNTEIATCPWNRKHRLLQVGLLGKKVSVDDMPPANLVFLLDVSGSMNSPNKLPLLKQSFKVLLKKLRPQDRVAIAVYAGSAGLALPSTPCTDDGKKKIENALFSLRAGGSTAGGAGIKLAYNVALANMSKKANNRVILATDGDFNVGVSSDSELVKLIEDRRDKGIFVTVLALRTGNVKDAKMELLADKGNGNYGYIDTLKEAKKVLGAEISGTLLTIAKDVKLQLEFNPQKVAAYRLIGYENRLMAKEDFNDDKKDSGDMGAGHTVTALYEIVPNGQSVPGGEVDELRYQKRVVSTEAAASKELVTVKLRFKKPLGKRSRKVVFPVLDKGRAFDDASENLRWAAMVAQFGQLLRNSKFKGTGSCEQVYEFAEQAKGKDLNGYRQEFLDLVEKATPLLAKR